MRRRWIVVGLVLAMVAPVFLSAGCVSRVYRRQVTVIIDRGFGRQPVKRYVEIAGYPTVLQVMKQAALIKTTTDEVGRVWITSIDDVGNDRDDVSWSFTVNDEQPLFAPSQQIVGPGDTVHWYAR